MRTRASLIGLGLAFMAMSAAAQTTVTSSGTTATTGNVPYVSASTSTSTTVSPSPISVSGGNVGIGTTAPDNAIQVLDASGNNLINFSNSQNGTFLGYKAGAVTIGADNTFVGYGAGSADTTGAQNTANGYLALNANSGGYFNTANGSQALKSNTTGIQNTANGAYALSNNTTGGNNTVLGYNAGRYILGGSTANTASNNSVYIGYNAYPLASGDTNEIVIGGAATGLGSNTAVLGNGNTVTTELNGNVGIGTTNPGAKLEVSGSLKLTSGSGGSITFQDGTTQSTAYTGVTCGGDYAESVDVSGSRTNYEPGDVLVIDPNVSGKFLKSAEPYSTSVSGIYSTKPGTVGRRQTSAKSPDEVPMAVVGIVPAKVSAENGPIKRGDLLVSSSKIGYAMKGTDRSRLVGAVIGKAMANLDSGTGVIEVLVTLQ